jgi:hypothetical protein
LPIAEQELSRLTALRLISSTILAVMFVVALTETYAVDPVMDSATRMLHEARKGADPSVSKAVLDSYLGYFGEERMGTTRPHLIALQLNASGWEFRDEALLRHLKISEFDKPTFHQAACNCS